jgi:hypothetical protein
MFFGFGKNKQKPPPILIQDPATGHGFVFQINQREVFRAADFDVVCLTALRQMYPRHGRDFFQIVELILRQYEAKHLYIQISRTCTDLPDDLAIPAAWIPQLCSIETLTYVLPIESSTEVVKLYDMFQERWIRTRWFVIFACAHEVPVEPWFRQGVGIDIDTFSQAARRKRVLLIVDTDDDVMIGLFPREAATDRLCDELIQRGLAQRVGATLS